jgi:hypothetical protein
MTAISGGVVSIEDGKKANEEYAPARKVRVELRFEVPEGSMAEKLLDATAVMANRKVMELLGHKEIEPSAPVQIVEPERKRVGRPPNPKREETDKNWQPENPNKDPSPPPPLVAEHISDEQLKAACGKRAGVTHNAVAIRTLIGQFTPNGAERGAEIPQERRAEFLKLLPDVPVLSKEGA